MLGWGVNSNGQIGLGIAAVCSFIATPKLIPMFNEYHCIQMTCSLTHSIFLLNDGTVRTSGNNDYKQLGREGRTTMPGRILSRMLLTTKVFLSRPSGFASK